MKAGPRSPLRRRRLRALARAAAARDRLPASAAVRRRLRPASWPQGVGTAGLAEQIHQGRAQYTGYSGARAGYLQCVLGGLGTVIVTYQNYGYHPLLLPLTHRASLPPTRTESKQRHIALMRK